MKKYFYCLIVFILLLSSCSFSKTDRKATLKVAIEKEISTLNYQKTAQSADMEQISQVMEGLLEFDEFGNVAPAGAKSWTISEDGLKYQFNLREDAKWEDGSVVTASDYYFAWLEIVENKTSPFAYTLFPIKNAEKIYRKELPTAEFGVSVIDQFTLEIELERPYLSFIYSLATATMFPLKQSFYERVGRETYGTAKESILTNGSYKIVEFEPASHLYLEKSSTYWDAKTVSIPNVEVYVVKEAAARAVLFDEGNLDILRLSTDYIDKYKNQTYQIVEKQTSRINYLFLSGETLQQNQLLKNLNLRKAISYAIDRQVLSANILKDGSIPLTRIVPCSFAFVDGQDYCDLVPLTDEMIFNSELALEYFTQAKSELSTEALVIDISYQELDDNAKILENIKYQLETKLPGLQITLNAIPATAYSATLRNDGIASAVNSWSGSFPNPEVYLQIFEKDSTFNFAKFNDQIFEEEYRQAIQAIAKKEQFLLYGKAEAEAMSAYMVLPLYQTGVTYALSTNLKNFTYKQTLPNIYYKNLQF